MSRYVFIADDFGMSPVVNAAVMETYRAGSIHGTSLMVDQKFTGEAVELVREAGSGLATGLHLNFSDARDLSAGWEEFPWRKGFPVTHRAARKGEFARRFVDETRRQFEAFHQTGLPLAFVNGHHHMHIQPVIFDEVRNSLRRLFPEFSGWVRLGTARFLGYPDWPLGVGARLVMTRDPDWTGPFTTHVWGSLPTFRTRAKAVVREVSRLSEGIHEFYFHPGADKSQKVPSGLGDDRQNRQIDLDALLDPSVIALAQAPLRRGPI